MSAVLSNAPLENADDPARFVRRYQSTNGIRMHYVEEGAGPLVVLLHGFPYLWYMWRRQIPAMATGVSDHVWKLEDIAQLAN